MKAHKSTIKCREKSHIKNWVGRSQIEVFVAQAWTNTYQGVSTGLPWVDCLQSSGSLLVPMLICGARVTVRLIPTVRTIMFGSILNTIAITIAIIVVGIRVFELIVNIFSIFVEVIYYFHYFRI